MDGRTKRFLLAGVIVAAVLAGLVSFYASSSPDGLERVATDSGIADREREHPLAGSPLGDYGVAGIANERLSGGLAGLIGMTATFALGTGVFWAIRRRSGDTGSGSAAGSDTGSDTGSGTGSGTAGGSGSATAAGRAE